MIKRVLYFLIFFLSLINIQVFAQTSTGQVSPGLIDLPSNFLTKINKKIDDAQKRLSRQSEKYVSQISKSEGLLQSKLKKEDSLKTAAMFAGNPTANYSLFISKYKADSNFRPSNITTYLPNEDTLQTSLLFLKNSPKLLSNSTINAQEIQETLGKLKDLQTKIQNADQIKQFIQSRKDQIKQYLAEYSHLPKGVTNIYQGYSAKLYYYSEQVKECRETINEPDKLFVKVLPVLQSMTAYQNFIKHNSYFASLYPNATIDSSSDALKGLQSKAQVEKLIKTHFIPSPDAQNALSQNVDAARSKLDELKTRMMNYGSSGSDMDLPDFKPNTQKSKSVLKRMEYSVDIQSQGASNNIPSAIELGLTLGYKFHNQNTVGVGGSYAFGIGKPLNHMQLSTNRIGIRSFIDLQVKGQIFLSGGFECNYNNTYMTQISATPTFIWQKSGLIGLTKITPLKGQLVKKIKFQILWDFLSYYQQPQTSPFKFRVAYAF